MKIERVHCVDEVHRQLLALIQDGTWKEGDRLASEAKLAKDFNVSRVVVREALQRLRGSNHIITRQGSGSFVANPANTDLQPFLLTEKMFRQINEFRRCIEFEAIRLSKTNATEEDYEKLRALAKAMDDTKDDLYRHTQVDFEFHYQTVCCSHNMLLMHAYKSCEKPIFEYLHETNKFAGSEEWSVNLHKNIAEHICNGDCQGAIDLLFNSQDYNAVRLIPFYAETENEEVSKETK